MGEAGQGHGERPKGWEESVWAPHLPRVGGLAAYRFLCQTSETSFW